MTTLIVRLGLVGAGVGATGFFGTILVTYAFELLQQFAMLLVILIGFWIVGWLFFIQFLKRQSNMVLQTGGVIAEQIMIYTALFQGILYTALVFMVVGTMGGFGELGESASQVVYDLSFAMGYLAIFIFGAASLTILFTYYRPRNRLLGIVYGLISVGMLSVAVFFAADRLRTLAEQNAAVYAFGFTVFLIFWSCLFMTMLTTMEDPNYKKKAEIRARLKKKQSRP